MSETPFNLLEVEYLHRILEAAVMEIPQKVRDELVAGGVSIQLRPEGMEGLTTNTPPPFGIFHVQRKVLVFWGGPMKATSIGHLAGKVAVVFAFARLWLKQDARYNEPARAREEARSWGIEVEEPNP